MCGITGIIDLQNNIIKEDLVKMTDRIKHRGPDSFGYYLDSFIGLGHRRLSIIDLSDAGKQPMYNEDGTIVIVFNGEIYNFKKLKTQLIKKHEFNSKTDTEVLIHGYEEWGITGLLSKLDGEFAFVIYDMIKKKIFGVRDQLGVKPLYYYKKDTVFAFASEMKAILSLDFVSKEVNKEALWYYLSFLAEPAPLTLINNIYKLPCGYYFCLDLKTNAFFTKKYFDIADINLNYNVTESNALSKIEELVLNSVRKKRIADVPIGVFLSGGVDSSLLVALNSKFSDYSVKTFSVYFEDPKQDESKYAEIVAKQFNTDHSFVYLDDDKIYNGIDLIGKWQDTPIADPVDLPLYYVSELAHNKGIKAVHVGEGSDEQFCGYSVYQRYLNFIEHNYFLINLKYKLFPQRYCDLGFIDKYFFPPRNFMSFYDYEKIFVVGKKYNSFENLKSLLPKDFVIKNKDDFFLAMRIIEYKLRLPELLNMRLDKFTMANSIESRVPFMDINLIKYSLQIPYILHMPNNNSKYLLKTISKKYLPSEIISRKKVGFGLNVEKILLNDEKLMYNKLLDSSLFAGIFNENLFKNLSKKHLKSFRGWSLFNLGLWGEQVERDL